MWKSLNNFNKRPKIPSLGNGSVADLKEFHIARRIHHPDRLNVEYVQDKLNAGR